MSSYLFPFWSGINRVGRGIQPNEGFKKQLKEYERRVKSGEAGRGREKGGGANEARFWTVVASKLGWRRHGMT